MSLKPLELDEFYRRLHARGVTCLQLAAQIGVGSPALSRVFNGARRRGAIWRRVSAFLMPDEVALLDAAHRHPWNRHRIAKRPRWAKVAAQFEGQGRAA